MSTLRFAQSGGKIRLICSPELTEEDAVAMAEGYRDRRDIFADALEREVESLIEDEKQRDSTAVLATLIRVGSLDVKVAFPRSGSGVYHEKVGLFEDRHGNKVSFKGSSNETYQAWDILGNVESFDAFCSWRPEDERRVRLHQQDFNRLWDGQDQSTEILNFTEVCWDKLKPYALESLGHAIEVAARKQAQTWKPKHDEPASNSDERNPFPHQVEALENWRARGFRGIFKHATGSGKTYTALLALKEHLVEGQAAVVVVPSKLLLSQWEEEIKKELGDIALLKVGAGNAEWKKNRLLENFSLPGQLPPRIILTTIQTAATEEFRSQIHTGEHLMLVADEVHTTGSRVNSNVLNIDAGRRLGLSATPERYGDPTGTAVLLDYFGGIVEPEFTLGDALAAGRLVPYDYYPQRVFLSDLEEERYEKLTSQIRIEYAKAFSGHNSPSEPLEISGNLHHLLIQRSSIIKKARAKVGLALSILQKVYRRGQYWLIYCQDRYQLEEVLQTLRDNNMPAIEYHSNMVADRVATLEWFRNHGEILVSIKCLDEGVDIPQTSHALILSSSQNPREFIQRRGRVLRAAAAKYEKNAATIYDVLVTPKSTDPFSYARSELGRALEFAQTARNTDGAMARIESFAIDAGVDLSDANNGNHELQ